MLTGLRRGPELAPRLSGRVSLADDLRKTGDLSKGFGVLRRCQLQCLQDRIFPHGDVARRSSGRLKRRCSSVPAAAGIGPEASWRSTFWSPAAPAVFSSWPSHHRLEYTQPRPMPARACKLIPPYEWSPSTIPPFRRGAPSFDRRCLCSISPCMATS
jgi:hypothetical protein